MGEYDQEKKMFWAVPNGCPSMAIKETIDYFNKMRESTTTRIAGGLDFTAKGGKR